VFSSFTCTKCKQPFFHSASFLASRKKYRAAHAHYIHLRVCFISENHMCDIIILRKKNAHDFLAKLLDSSFVNRTVIHCHSYSRFTILHFSLIYSWKYVTMETMSLCGWAFITLKGVLIKTTSKNHNLWSKKYKHYYNIFITAFISLRLYFRDNEEEEEEQ